MTRGRAPNLALPPTRQLIHQRDYRARKAQHLFSLEEKVKTLEARVEDLEEELRLERAAKGTESGLSQVNAIDLRAFLSRSLELIQQAYPQLPDDSDYSVRRRGSSLLGSRPPPAPLSLAARTSIDSSSSSNQPEAGPSSYFGSPPSPPQAALKLSDSPPLLASHDPTTYGRNGPSYQHQQQAARLAGPRRTSRTSPNSVAHPGSNVVSSAASSSSSYSQLARPPSPKPSGLPGASRHYAYEHVPQGYSNPQHMLPSGANESPMQGINHQLLGGGSNSHGHQPDFDVHDRRASYVHQHPSHSQHLHQQPYGPSSSPHHFQPGLPFGGNAPPHVSPHHPAAQRLPLSTSPEQALYPMPMGGAGGSGSHAPPPGDRPLPVFESIFLNANPSYRPFDVNANPPSNLCCDDETALSGGCEIVNDRWMRVDPAANGGAAAHSSAPSGAGDQGPGGGAGRSDPAGTEMA